MKKTTRRMITLLLALVMAFSVSSTCFAAAASQATEEDLAIQAAIDMVLADYPGAKITVSEDGQVHALLPKEISAPQTRAATSQYAPEGGYYSFSYTPAPIGNYPLAITYMVKEDAEGFVKMLNDQNLASEIWNIVHTNSSNLATILTPVINKLGVNINLKFLSFILSIGTVGILADLNAGDASRALSGSNGLKIIRGFAVTGTGSVAVNLYQGWDGQYVNPEPYAGYNPTFHPGEYRI